MPAKFFKTGGGARSTQRQKSLVFDKPFDSFAASELHGLSEGGGEVDVPLFAGFAFDELNFGEKAHGRKSSFLLTS